MLKIYNDLFVSLSDIFAFAHTVFNNFMTSLFIWEIKFIGRLFKQDDAAIVRPKMPPCP